MPQVVTFNDALEAVDQLSPDDQEALIAIVRRRLADQGRQRILADVLEGEKEFAEGRCRAMTVEEIMRESLS